MKILYVIPGLKKGGAERIAIDICREISLRKGHQCLLLVLSNENEYRQLTTDIAIQQINSTVQLSLLRKNKIDLQEFDSVVNEFKPNIIHSHLFAAEILSREKIFPHIKYFTHCHDNMSQLRNFSTQTFFQKKLLIEFYEKQHLLKNYLKSNNKFIAISEHTKKYFERVLPAQLQKNIFLLHNAIAFKQFNAVNELQKPFDKIRILNVGSFVPKKNQKLFIAIAEELRSRHLDFEITLLGNGPIYAEIKKLTESKKLEQFFSMPGNVADVENYYARANLYIHTATYEPFGLVLLEAMATGLPVISLNGGGNQDLINDNENGFMIHDQNPKFFADKVELLFHNRNLFSKLSTGAVEFAKKFDIANYVDQLLMLYAKA